MPNTYPSGRLHNIQLLYRQCRDVPVTPAVPFGFRCLENHNIATHKGYTASFFLCKLITTETRTFHGTTLRKGFRLWWALVDSNHRKMYISRYVNFKTIYAKDIFHLLPELPPHPVRRSIRLSCILAKNSHPHGLLEWLIRESNPYITFRRGALCAFKLISLKPS